MISLSYAVDGILLVYLNFSFVFSNAIKNNSQLNQRKVHINSVILFQNEDTFDINNSIIPTFSFFLDCTSP